MKKIIKNYKQSIILIGSLVIGTIVGLIFKEKATVLEPLGTLFINMLLVVVVPLIFLSITTSIGKIDKPKRVGKILRSIIIAFVFTSLVSVVIGLTSLKIRLVDSGGANKITALLDESTEVSDDASVLDKLVNSVSTNDFVNLLSKNNILALIVISFLSGLAINKSGEKGKSFLKVLDSAYEVLQNLIKILMYYAPIGLGCYFASFTGTFGASVTQGFVKMLVIYTILVLFVYFVIYSLYAYMAAGKIGVKKYWANIIPASVIALSTCSSAASIPVNTECAKKIGVSEDIASPTITLGTSFHKDGSIIGSVFKIMFLVYLFDMPVSGIKVLGVSLLATILVTAVPIGGGTISEMLILKLMGFPVAALPILTIIATIIDAPATILNVTGDCASSMLVSRMVDGKDSLKKELE
ncbi:MAG: dicarboxylate/amino acid:cation symporter [Tenericutes bacterium]|nr:dicarboxylate/amino acid:cation symporter [Mycoplasmatota bacterium]